MNDKDTILILITLRYILMYVERDIVKGETKNVLKNMEQSLMDRVHELVKQSEPTSLLYGETE